MSKKTFYVTTPIYYPSGSLHIGHVFTTTLAVTIANYKKLMGYDVKMLTGADEHGEKIEKKAQTLSTSPQDYVNKMSREFQNLWKNLRINYDFFSRTTSAKHQKVVQHIFTKLLDDQVIYKSFYNGLYSVEDEEFLTVSQAVKKGSCYFHPVSNHELKVVQEESYFLKTSLYSKWIKDFISQNPGFVFPRKTQNELFRSFLDKGLGDLSVSRTSFKWGVPVNEDPNHVIYVWFDALCNYISALNYSLKNQQDFVKYWENGREIVHVVGKEITRFHCIYWPIILKALNLKMPSKIVSHGWIITPEGKMSKSKGNVVDPFALIKEFGPDEVKYYFASQMPVEEDGVFDKEVLKRVINADLNNTFGNLLSRTTAMVEQNFQGSVPSYNPTKLGDLDQQMLEDITSCQKAYHKHFDSYKVHEALRTPIYLAKRLNGYVDQTKPWTLRQNKEELGVILNTLLQGLYACCFFLFPVMPDKVAEAMSQLGNLPVEPSLVSNYHKFDNLKVKKGKNLFSRHK